MYSDCDEAKYNEILSRDAQHLFRSLDANVELLDAKDTVGTKGTLSIGFVVLTSSNARNL